MALFHKKTVLFFTTISQNLLKDIVKPDILVSQCDVNAYYFGNINVDADNDCNNCDCRKRKFELPEKQPDFFAKCSHLW